MPKILESTTETQTARLPRDVFGLVTVAVEDHMQVIGELVAEYRRMRREHCDDGCPTCHSGATPVSEYVERYEGRLLELEKLRAILNAKDGDTLFVDALISQM